MAVFRYPRLRGFGLLLVACRLSLYSPASPKGYAFSLYIGSRVPLGLARNNWFLYSADYPKS